MTDAWNEQMGAILSLLKKKMFPSTHNMARLSWRNGFLELKSIRNVTWQSLTLSKNKEDVSICSTLDAT